MAILQTQVESSVPEVAKCKNMIITYEPVLAIETGLLPANEEIQSIHFVIYGLMGLRWLVAKSSLSYIADR